MANWSARTRKRAPAPFTLDNTIGNVSAVLKPDALDKGPLYEGLPPDWDTNLPLGVV